MRADARRFLRECAVLALALGVATCTDNTGPSWDLGPALYVTPTGLVTGNPPEIFVGAGDMATCSNTGDSQTAALLDGIPDVPVFTLGDNSYPNATTTEFTNCYHPTWGRHKARTHPSAGNHDYNSSGATPYYNYFGAAAGTPGQGYYGFDLGAWHVIVLNSNISSSAGSAQDNWLKAELAAHSNLCTLAYWHHPLYSSVGSGSTNYPAVRRFWDDLYAAGADLVLNGHRHDYERIAPIKPDGTQDNTFGIRTFVAGMGGVGSGSMNSIFPASEVRNGTTLGVLKLYLYDDSYAWKFIPVAGKTFTDSGSTACHPAPGGGGGGVSASLSTVSAAPTTITASTGASAATITVTAKDASGNPVSGATVVLAATGSGNTLTQPANPTNASGVATGTLSSTVAQAKTVSATISGIAITQTSTVTVNAGAASALGFVQQPTDAPTGAAITPAVTVEIRNQFGARLTSATNSVTLAIGTNPAGGTLSGTTTVAAVNGLATFPGLNINNAGIDYTLTGSSSGLSGATSSSFDITAVPVATALGFVQQPTTSQAGASITPAVTVEIRDQFGARLTSATNSVTLAIGTNPGGGTLGGTTTVAAVNGLATFPGLNINNAGTGYTLTGSSSGLSGATSSAFNITAPPAGITHTLLTSGTILTNQNLYTTASISPAPNTLVTIAVMSHRSTATISPTVSGGGMASWTLVTSVDFDTLSLPHRRLSIYRAMSASPGSGPITFNYSSQVSNVEWVVSQWGGVETSGANGAGAIGQTGSARADAGTGLSVPLASFGNANNVGFGAFGVNSGVVTITPGSGFTEIDEQPANESTKGDLQAEWAVNRATINATWTNLKSGALGIEIKAKP